MDWKFASQAARYHDMIERISADVPARDLIHNAPAFAGLANLSRYLALYEVYKRTLGLNGHIAEVGVWKGASFLFFAKLCEIFEPHAYTEVHGFDWFEGMAPGENDRHITAGSYRHDEEALRSLIEAQSLGHVAKLHKLDVAKDMPAFFANHELRFRLVFLDAGAEKVVRAGIEHFWPRLLPGGIMLFDQFNEPRTPGETIAVSDLLPRPVHTFPWTRQPTGYVVKD
jgi:hypothetical protein